MILLKFEFLIYFFTLNWIVTLGIEYFGNLETYCFEKNVNTYVIQI